MGCVPRRAEKGGQARGRGDFPTAKPICVTEPAPLLTVAAILTLGILAAGCGKDASARLPVYGYVTCANGESFSGSITFVPDKGRPGPAATTGVRGGYYRFDGTNGPTAGPHKVMIRKIVPPGEALKSLGQKDSPHAGSGKTAWTLSADVKLDGPYRFDFKLDP